MWEIHMLGLTRRGMETGSESTAPFLDPTLGGLGLATAPSYPVFETTEYSSYSSQISNLN